MDATQPHSHVELCIIEHKDAEARTVIVKVLEKVEGGMMMEKYS